MAKILYDVTFADGKYRLVYFEAAPPEAFRNGHAWEAGRETISGSNMILALVAEISDLREKLEPTETISETPATAALDAIPVHTVMPINWDQIANCIVGLVENRYSPWLGTFQHGDDEHSATLRDTMKADGKIWYAEADYYTRGGKLTFTFDDPDKGDDGDFSATKTVGAQDLAAALVLLAAKVPFHFGNLIGENDDAGTHDVFGQMLLLGDEIYA